MKTLISVSDVVERFGVSERWLRQLTTDKRIPRYRLDSMLRFDEDEATAWLEDHHVTPRQSA